MWVLLSHSGSVLNDRGPRDVETWDLMLTDRLSVFDSVWESA